MSKVELYEKIRRARRDEALRVRALAARFRVHRLQTEFVSGIGEFAGSNSLAIHRSVHSGI